MHLSAEIVLSVWLVIGVAAFFVFPVRRALLFDFLGGWALLPTSAFHVDPSPFPYWLLGSALPSIHMLTKATAIGAAALAGILLRQPSALRSLRPSWRDLPMLAWCLAPLVTGIAHPQMLSTGLRGVAYLGLAWGIPYLAGRIVFATSGSLLELIRAFVVAGLLYVPVCLFEFVRGPQLYAWLYGFEPYRWIGADRYIGHRPVGFLEDGNQLGIWMATAALLATCLWRRTEVRRILGLPIHLAAILLIAITLLCQSGGSILLLFCIMPFALIRGGQFQKRFVLVLACLMVCLAGLRLSNVVSLRALVNHHRAARSAEHAMAHLGRESFGWRLEQDERHVKTALEHRWVGSGEWDWWREGRDRPWSLWLLAFGMYGIVGLAALEALQFLPAIESGWKTGHLRHATAAAILISAIDNLLNSCPILPVLLLLGALNAAGSDLTEESPRTIHYDKQEGAPAVYVHS
ncbi:hypothetical protein [Silvibacterium acidisoli]|uniref:hypothetical protein n=1 Tax=Acidobacteriaceae bacterium ZG23-2 TaxID=2883246 RepID=UPI00406D3284